MERLCVIYKGKLAKYSSMALAYKPGIKDRNQTALETRQSLRDEAHWQKREYISRWKTTSPQQWGHQGSDKNNKGRMMNVLKT